jgi:chromosome segregation ATPase
VREKVRAVVRDLRGQIVLVNFSTGNKDLPENANDYRHPQASLSNIQILNKELRHIMEACKSRRGESPEFQVVRSKSRRKTSTNADEAFQDDRTQTQGSQTGHEVQQERLQADTTGTASENQRLGDVDGLIEDLRNMIRQLRAEVEQLQAQVQQLQDEKDTLQTALNRSVEYSTRIHDENSTLKEDLKRSQEGLARTLQSMADIDNYLALLGSDDQPPNIAEIRAPAYPEENDSSAGLKRDMFDDEGESSRRVAKRFKQGDCIDVAGSPSRQ